MPSLLAKPWHAVGTTRVRENPAPPGFARLTMLVNWPAGRAREQQQKGKQLHMRSDQTRLGPSKAPG